MKRQNQIGKMIAKSAIIAALYIVIGLVFQPWEFGPVQFRPSEMLNMLVFFTPSAIWGLFVGCIISNLASPYGWIDILFGSLATLLSGLIAVRIKNKYLVGIPSVVINGFVVAGVIAYMTDTASLYFLYVAQIALGQLLSVYVLGLPMLLFIGRNEKLKNLIEH